MKIRTVTQRENVKYTYYHCITAGVLLSIAIVITLWSKMPFAMIIAAPAAIPGMCIWMSRDDHFDFCRGMASFRFTFAQEIAYMTKNHPDQIAVRNCQKCGRHGTCLKWCYKWRCESCYNDFNAYWNQESVKELKR